MYITEKNYIAARTRFEKYQKVNLRILKYDTENSEHAKT